MILPSWNQPGPERPRVVAHSCSNTEIVCALGCAELLVGVDDHSDFPPAVVSHLPRVGADLDIDPALVAALKPDLVLASNTVPGHEQCIANLKAEGLPLEVIAPRSLACVAEDIRTIARLLGVAARGQRLSAAFELAMVEDAIECSDSPVSILVEWWPKPVIVPGRESWVTELIQRAGGINPWSNEAVQSRPVSDEEVVAAAPQAVVMSWCGVAEDKYHPHIVRRRPQWQSVPAVANGHVYPISEAWLGRPGPRLVEGLGALRTVINQVRQSL